MMRSIKQLILLALVLSSTIIVKAQDSSAISEGVSTTNTILKEFSGDDFLNLNSKGTEAGAKLQWQVAYESVREIEEVLIRYKRKINKDNKAKPWNYSGALSSTTTKHELSELKTGEQYVWEVGCRKDGGSIKDILNGGSPDESQMVWSKAGKFETDRPWGLYKFLMLLGSLGVFIFGMKLMSEGLQQSAGGKLRQILSGMTSNRFLGVMSGFLITALVQSSSATTVMTVSFVNAGLLTLVESAGVMMGANIGTTITGWLVSIFGFKVSISSYALLIIAVGAPLMFFNKSKMKAWANTLIGFAILFMGLGFLKDAVPTLDANSPIVQFFQQFTEHPFLARVMFVLLGTLVTVVIQSSSAAMALTLTMVHKGIIPFEVGAAMILGENIGTTITAELASLVGNVHAKRSARIHSMFNIVGVTWMIFLMPVFIKGISHFISISPTDDGEGATLALAAFHTVFNATNVLIMIWMVPILVRLAEITVPSKGEEDEVFKLEYISTSILPTPDLALVEAKKEVTKFGELCLKMNDRFNDLVNSFDSKERLALIKKIGKYEDITDRMEHEIATYLAKVSQEDLSDTSSSQLRGMLSVINDLERVGDIYFEMAKTIERKNEDKIWFDQKQRDALNDLLKAVREGLIIMIGNLTSEAEIIDIRPADLKETEINVLRDKIRRKHLKSIEAGDYNVKAGMIYSNIFASLERVGDHIINISEALAGKMH